MLVGWRGRIGDIEMNKGLNGISDLRLERFLAGDLSAEASRALERQVQGSPELRSRLTQLLAQKTQFLESHPPEGFAHALVARLGRDTGVGGRCVLSGKNTVSRVDMVFRRPAGRKGGPCRWMGLALTPMAMAAATLIFVLVDNSNPMPGDRMASIGADPTADQNEAAKPGAAPWTANKTTPVPRVTQSSRAKRRPARRSRHAEASGRTISSAESAGGAFAPAPKFVESKADRNLGGALHPDSEPTKDGVPTSGRAEKPATIANEDDLAVELSDAAELEPSNTAKVMLCLSAARERNALHGGTHILTVRWTEALGGYPMDPRIVGSPRLDPQGRKCVADVVRRWPLPTTSAEVKRLRLGPFRIR